LSPAPPGSGETLSNLTSSKKAGTFQPQPQLAVCPDKIEVSVRRQPRTDILM
jgi:hypothetical protein